MALNNTYDRSRDPRLSRRSSNVEMSDVITTGATPNPHSATLSSSSNLAATTDVTELLTRVVDQEADNTRLQQEKTNAKQMAKNLHSRLNQTTQSLTDLTISYAKRLEEKNTILNENVAIEKHHTQVSKENAKSARAISNMTIKIQEMEAQIQAYEIENAELQKRVATLETESHTLQCRVHDLEFAKEQEEASEVPVADMWQHRRDSAQRYRSDANSTSPHYDTGRDREARYSEAEYVEHRRKSGGLYESDVYRPDPRRERDRERDSRGQIPKGRRFNVDQQPPVGRRFERR